MKRIVMSAVVVGFAWFLIVLNMVWGGPSPSLDSQRETALSSGRTPFAQQMGANHE
jgi:hypothetical protein